MVSRKTDTNKKNYSNALYLIQAKATPNRSTSPSQYIHTEIYIAFSYTAAGEIVTHPGLMG